MNSYTVSIYIPTGRGSHCVGIEQINVTADTPAEAKKLAGEIHRRRKDDD